MNPSKIEKAVSDILQELQIKDDVLLKETPRRIAKMYQELTSGQAIDASTVLNKTFPLETNNIVTVKDIFFSSLCEHHLMPFFGESSIAYVPNGKVVGISKLGRVVDILSHRLQLQERLTAQVGETIFSKLQPHGILVISKAKHTCMICRGVKKSDSTTVSFFKKGNISEQQVKMMLEI